MDIKSKGDKFFDGGGRPRFSHVVREMCFLCCNGFLDGKIDCGIRDCPIYCMQPYRKLDPDFKWRTNGAHLQVNAIAYKYGIVPSGEGVVVPSLNAFGRPPKREIIRAMCYKCTGNFIDGREDCEITDCPFYYWQPYRKLEPDFGWVKNGLRLISSRSEIRKAEKLRRSKRAEIMISGNKEVEKIDSFF